MIKEKLLQSLAQAITANSTQLNNLDVTPETLSLVKFERPKNPTHGDFAVNVSPLAKLTKMPPPKIAEILSNQLGNGKYQTEVVAGFINFKLDNQLLLESLATLVKNPTPGKNQSMADQRILLEYVSANPTGPLHIGHGRWAALGDSLVRLWRHCGATVSPEFYINDAGVQMQNITFSVYIRALELLNQDNVLTSTQADLSDLGEPPYPGEYVIEIAKQFLQLPDSAETILQARNKQFQGQNIDLLWLTAWVRDQVLESQKNLLQALGVTFDTYFSEKQKLYGHQLPEKVLEKLKTTHPELIYEQDGAVWFKTTELGDEKDRVLKKSDGSFTYLTPDIAYHDEKFSRVGPDGQPLYNRIVNIWGADHHGYIPRMKAAIQALGHPVDQFQVILGQLVNLIVDGEKTRMGKRRKMLTLQDVVDEVGVDATRFWMTWKPADTALDFDVELATSATSENPVFYVQYAHARCCSILRTATESALDQQTAQEVPPRIQSADLAAYESALTTEQLQAIFKGVEEPTIEAAVKTLILRLDGFEELVKDAARMPSPHLIARYAIDLAADFHSFYSACRVITDDSEVTKARLMLIRGLQKVLAQCLSILGVSAPERM